MRLLFTQILFCLALFGHAHSAAIPTNTLARRDNNVDMPDIEQGVLSGAIATTGSNSTTTEDLDTTSYFFSRNRFRYFKEDDAHEKENLEQLDY